MASHHEWQRFISNLRVMWISEQDAMNPTYPERGILLYLGCIGAIFLCHEEIFSVG